MDHPGFFENKGPFRVSQIAQLIGAEIVGADGADGDGDGEDIALVDIKPLDLAGEGHLSFLDNRKYLSRFKTTKASACIVSPKFAKEGNASTRLLVIDDPYRAFAMALQHFYPEAASPFTYAKEGDNGRGLLVHPSAQIEDGVIIEPGVIIGQEARIGSGTRISAGAVIGYRSYIGRDCKIGPNVNLAASIIGNDVTIHQGASIGQDGFGFAMGPGGHLKVPQIGRVVIQDHVEIGANTTIDRGALKDTIIGEGAKIDNLVQIGHNAVIGRHCVIVAQVGISGSSILEDYVVFGGQSACIGHVTVGMGAQVAANGKVSKSIAAGEIVSGAPAVPIKQWKRELIALRRLAKTKK